jgi:hypothetical protein
VPPEWITAIGASETALAVSWVPQDALLAHPAVGWFITHGGWNSTQEALLAKVPLWVSFYATFLPRSAHPCLRIFYPISGDQPANALLMTIKHEAAFEFLSVRTGVLGEQLPYRCRNGPVPEFSPDGVKKETRELLKRLNGEEGRRVRANFERLGEAYSRNWEESGEARLNLEGFLTKYVN